MAWTDLFAEIKAHPKRFLAAFLVGMVPVLNLLSWGYAHRVLQETSRQRKPTLPAFEPSVELWLTGLKVGLLLFLYNLVPGLLQFVLAVLAAWINSPLAALLVLLVSIVLSFAAMMVFFIAWKRFAATDSFKQGLRWQSFLSEALERGFLWLSVKLTVFAVLVLVVARMLGLFGLLPLAGLFLFLLVAAMALGLRQKMSFEKISIPTPPKRGGPGQKGLGQPGLGRKGLLVLGLVLLLVGEFAFVGSHMEPIQSQTQKKIGVELWSVKLIAPSFWQWLWLSEEELSLTTRVNETQHDHGWQSNAFQLDKSANASWDPLGTSGYFSFSKPKPPIYSNLQCHYLDDPTDGCFEVKNSSIGITWKFMQKLFELLAGQILKTLTGQITPGGIAIDFLVGLVTDQISGFLGLDAGILDGLTGAGKSSAGSVQAAGTSEAINAGMEALGKATEEGAGMLGQSRLGKAVTSALEKQFGKGTGGKIGLNITLGALTDILVKIISELIFGLIPKTTTVLASGCANLATESKVGLSGDYTGYVLTLAREETTDIQCEEKIVPPTTGTIYIPPDGTGKTGGDPWREPPPIPPPEPPPVTPLPPTTPGTPGGAKKCTSEKDCYDLDQYYCSGLVAHADMGQCIKGECRVLKQSRDCDDKKDSTEDLCEASKTDVKCINRPRCGNGKQDSGENCSNCSKDVKCAAGQYCEAGVCKEPPCAGHGGDTDGDGTCDDVDNCKDIPNDQRDLDGDGTGDVCDEAPIDCGGWAAESGHESFSSGWTTPGTEAAAKDFCVREMWKGVDTPVCYTPCLKVFVSVYLTPNNVFTCCARYVTRIACDDCPGQHPNCHPCGEDYDSWIGGGPVVEGGS